MIPLNDIGWALLGADDRPSLHPSVGNWNLECQSHYVLWKGRVRSDRRFSQSGIEAVRRRDLRPYQQTSWLQKVGEWTERVATEKFLLLSVT
jgi:hypothetical protein